MEGRLGSTNTVKGLGSPVPAVGSARAGSRASSSSDCNARDVEYLASGADNATSKMSPFAKRPKVQRSPPSTPNASAEPREDNNQNITKNSSDSENKQDKAENEIILNLQKQLQCAMKEIENLRQQIETLTAQTKVKSQYKISWDEEEETVARETDWILKGKNNKKKRKASESPEKSNNVPKKTEIKNKSKPPPIVLSNVQNYDEIKQKLQMDKFNCNTCMLNNKQIKVNVSNETEYREITKMINKTDIEWHTYENKAIRPIRVMLRDLHPSCDVKDITEELREREFKIISVVQKLKKITRRNEEPTYIRLPLYILTFEHTEDINKIYNIKHVNHMKIKIEAIKTNKLIAQCKKCQRYGHTQKFCNRPPNCVKCAGNHPTTECSKPRNSPPKCANCNEAHPANYRGCIVAKELQKRRDKIIKNKKYTNQTKTFTSNMKKDGVLYSTIAKENTREMQQENSEGDHNTEPSMMQMLQNIMKTLEQVNRRLDNLEARNSGAIPKTK